MEGIKPGTSHEPIIRRADDSEPFAALAFKIQSDAYVGKLTYFRVYSGHAAKGDTVLNVTTGRKERFGRLLRMHANHREDIDDVFTGDIVAAVGLKSTTTGDTLTAVHAPIQLESMTFPAPVISIAIEPRTKADQDKLGDGLRRLAEEDPTFLVRGDEETGQTILWGMGELHLEVLVDRLQREFDVQRQRGPAAGRLPGDDPRGGPGGRGPLRQADRRARPVRPRGHRPGAQPGRRLRVRRPDQGRGHPPRVHPVGRRRHRGGAGVGRARRVPDAQRASHPGGRLAPRRRFLGPGLQDRRLHGPASGGPPGRRRSCSSRSWPSRW